MCQLSFYVHFMFIILIGTDLKPLIWFRPFDCHSNRLIVLGSYASIGMDNIIHRIDNNKVY